MREMKNSYGDNKRRPRCFKWIPFHSQKWTQGLMNSSQHGGWRRNGNPLQCSCLENPRDWGAWWAAVYGVAQSRTRLKRLSSSSSSKEGCCKEWLCPSSRMSSWDRPPSEGPWLKAEFRSTTVKWKQVSLERSIGRMLFISVGERGPEVQGCRFYGLGDFIFQWVGGLFQLLWRKGKDFQELGHSPHFGLFMFSQKTVMVPVGMSFSIC